jgi:hypothetical protein
LADPSDPRPAAAPVSSLLRIEATGKVAQIARESLAIIDTVHGVGVDVHLKVPVFARRVRGSLGGFAYFKGGRPSHIDLSPRSDAPHLDFFHEIGHLMDHQLIGAPGEYSSLARAPVLTNWWMAIEASKAFRRLCVLSKKSRARVVESRGLARYLPVDRTFAQYLLRPHELFARSYSQFIAVESQHPALLYELHNLRSPKSGCQQYPELWDDADFVDVLENLRRVIIELEWRK